MPRIRTHNPQLSPDNSVNNKVHREIADQQMDNSSDRETTQKIRKALIADKSLSTYGHNVEIIHPEWSSDFERPGSFGAREGHDCVQGALSSVARFPAWGFPTRVLF
jgi:hypothetical protein